MNSNATHEQTRIDVERTSRIAGSLRRYIPYVFVVLAYVLAHGIPILTGRSPVLRGDLTDTDSYLHLMIAGELHETGSWFNRTLARSNAPYGETLHTTRPFTVLLLAGAWPLVAFLGFRDALYWSGALISPVLHVVLAVITAWATRPFLSRESRVVLMLLLLIQPALLAYAAPGRADHHVLILVVFAASLGMTVRMLSRPYYPRFAIAAGMVAGFGLWLSVEFLLTLAVALAVTSLAWVRSGGDEAWKNTWYSLGLVGALILALALERPYAERLAVEYDRVSIVHLSVALIALGFWVVIASAQRRMGQLECSVATRVVTAVAGAGAAVALQLAFFPGFFAGPLADLDPQMETVFLDRIAELQPLFPTNRTRVSDFLLYIGGAIAAAPYIAWRLIEERSGPRWPFWLYTALAMLFFLPVALYQRRFTTYVEILMMVAVVDLVFGRVLPKLGHLRPLPLRVLARGGVAGGLLIGFTLLGAVLATPTAAEPVHQACSLRRVAEYLNDPRGYGEHKRTILVSINLASELLYRTPHRTIASASHRNSAGIIDTYRVLATSDERESLRIIRQRGVDLILLCPSASERGLFTPAHQASTNTLYRRLLEGDTPDWLRSIRLPSELDSTFKLYQVTGNGASR